MPSLRNAAEPLGIALVLTVGTLINRRPGESRHGRYYQQYRDDSDDDVEAVAVNAKAKDDNDDDDERHISKFVTPLLDSDDENCGPILKVNLLSRILAYFPFLIEIWYWLLSYWIYQGLRALSARLISSNPSIFGAAVSHAEAILSLERLLHIDMELGLQRFLLARFPFLATAVLPRVYFSHIVLGVAFLVYAYTVLPRHTFAAIRRTMALENALAFCVLTVYRCCPPRLMPADQGYEYRDLVHESSGNTAWTENRFRLVIAAMPSLHFANSVLVGWALARFSPHRVLRILGPLWPALMWFTIVGTANHWVMDTVVGVGVLVAAWQFNRVMLVFLPVEERVFRWLGVD